MLRNYISYIVKNLLIPENKKFFYENKNTCGCNCKGEHEKKWGNSQLCTIIM
jgi:hypothetical protein